MASITFETLEKRTATAVEIRSDCVVLSGATEPGLYRGHKSLSEMIPVLLLLSRVASVERALGHPNPIGLVKHYIEALTLADIKNDDAIQSKINELLLLHGCEYNGTGYNINLSIGSVQITSDLLQSIEGSHFSSFLFSILPNQENSKVILWTALLAALFDLSPTPTEDTIATSTVPPTDIVMQPADSLENIDEVLYICTFGGSLRHGDRSPIDEAIAILSNSDDSVETVKARQSCLKAMGLYDGAIDGIAGKRTREAEQKLIEKYNLTHAAWHDTNFCFFVIRRAALIMSTSGSP